MSAEYRKLLVRRAKMTASALGIGIGLAFGSSGQAAAVDCVNGPTQLWLMSPNDPPASDERAIRKLISMYHWALDDHRAPQLANLFVDTVFYELCNAAGEQLTQKTNRTQLEGYLQDYFNEFTDRGTQSRHIESNTVLNAVDADTIQGKTTVVVTLQHPDIETPVLDYTASFRTEFEKQANIWKFSRMTLITDGPKLELRAR